MGGLPASVTQVQVAHYRVDEDHSNPYAVWKKQGSPVAPTRPQYTALEASSQLALLQEASPSGQVDHGSITVSFSLPRQAVSLLVLTW